MEDLDLEFLPVSNRRNCYDIPCPPGILGMVVWKDMLYSNRSIQYLHPVDVQYTRSNFLRPYNISDARFEAISKKLPSHLSNLYKWQMMEVRFFCHHFPGADHRDTWNNNFHRKDNSQGLVHISMLSGQWKNSAKRICSILDHWGLSE